MEVTSWNVHHGSYLMERIPWKITSGNNTMEVALWNLHHGCYLVEPTTWRLSHGT